MFLSLSLLFKKTYCIKTKYTRTKGKTRDLGLLVRCIRFLLDFFLALSLRLDLVCTFNVTNEQKKTRKNQMCAQYTWKPLVERRVHIETNKHITRCMFISSETTNKNKNGWRKKKKQREKIFFLAKFIKKNIFQKFYSTYFLDVFFLVIMCYFIFLTKRHLFFLLFVAPYDGKKPIGRPRYTHSDSRRRRRKKNRRGARI